MDFEGLLKIDVHRTGRKSGSKSLSIMPEDDSMSPDEAEFCLAMDAFRRMNNRPFPKWTEALAVAKALGYRKVAEPRRIQEV